MRKLISTTLVVLALAGCSKSEPLATEAKLTPITIAQYGHIFLYMPLYVAVDKGFFKDEGLNVNLVSTGGDEKTFAAVSSGSAQFGVSDPTFAAIARERGQGGKVVAGVVRGVPFWMISFKDGMKPAKSPAELAGQRIATYTAPSTSYAVVKKLLQNNGHAVKAKIVEGAFGSLLAMLKADQADIAQEIEPIVSIATNEGAKIVYSPAKELGDFAFTGMTVSDDYHREHPEVIQHAVNALARAMTYIKTDFEGAVEVAQKEFPELSPAIVRSALTRLKDQGTIPPSPMLEESAWKKAIALRKEIGDIQGNGDYAENVDMKFVQQTQKQ